MNASDQRLLTACLNALAQLDNPLPPDVQSKFNDLAETMKANPDTIGNLDIIVEDYPPLNELYQAEQRRLDQNAGIRNKGLPPLPLSNEPTQELTNSAIDTFNASDSVTKAKTKNQPNLLKRLWQGIRGED
jgi:hypothetical protein